MAPRNQAVDREAVESREFVAVGDLDQQAAVAARNTRSHAAGVLRSPENQAMGTIADQPQQRFEPGVRDPGKPQADLAGGVPDEVSKGSPCALEIPTRLEIEGSDPARPRRRDRSAGFGKGGCREAKATELLTHLNGLPPTSKSRRCRVAASSSLEPAALAQDDGETRAAVARSLPASLSASLLQLQS